MIVIQNCKQVRVSGLSLKNEASWGLVFIYCEDVVVEGVTVRVTEYVPSSDGMDVDSCRRVRITRCDIQAHDDCISIKSGRDEAGLRANRPSEDIVVENTRFGYGQGAVALGSETSGGIRNVEVRDCVVEDGNWAAVRLKSAPSRGGTVENIIYRNIELRGVLKAFEMNPAWGGPGTELVERPAGVPQRETHQRLRRRPIRRHHYRPERQPDLERQIRELQGDGAARPRPLERERRGPLRPRPQGRGRRSNHPPGRASPPAAQP